MNTFRKKKWVIIEETGVPVVNRYVRPPSVRRAQQREKVQELSGNILARMHVARNVYSTKGEREEARRQIQKLQLVNSASARAEGYGNWKRTQCYVISSRLHVFPRLKARSLHTFSNKSCEGLSLDPFLREKAIHMHVSYRPSSVNVNEVLKN